MKETNIESAPSYHVNIKYAGDLIAQYSDKNFERFNIMRTRLEDECKRTLIKQNNFGPLIIEIYQYL